MNVKRNCFSTASPFATLSLINIVLCLVMLTYYNVYILRVLVYSVLLYTYFLYVPVHHLWHNMVLNANIN